MVQNGLRNTILSNFDSLSPAEQKVVDFIWNNLETVLHLSSRELAKIASVSAGTVINACRALGFDGFQSLKLAVAQEVGRKEYQREPFKKLYPYLGLVIETVEATAKSIDPHELHKASAILKDASSVVLFGGGASGRVGHLAAEILAYFGRLANSFDQLSTLKAVSQYVDEKTAVIVVSHRGKEAEVVDAVKGCRLRGGRTIGITNYGNSPLAQECEAVLQTSIHTLEPDVDLIVQPVREIQMAVLHLLIFETLKDQPVYHQTLGFLDEHQR